MEDSLDIYDATLSENIEQLQECQKQKSVDSCMKCSEILECILRKKYVDSVYASMNKGHGGGFEF